MRILLEKHPEKFCMEWVLLGKIEPTQLFSNLVEFEEKKEAFVQGFEGHTFSLMKTARKIGADGTHLYTTRFDGNLLFGQEIVNYLCHQMNLTKRSLLAFQSTNYKLATMKKRVSDVGYVASDSTGIVHLYKKGEISTFLVDGGIYMQVRGQHESDWKRLVRLLEKEIDILTSISEPKRKGRIA